MLYYQYVYELVVLRVTNMCVVSNNDYRLFSTHRFKNSAKLGCPLLLLYPFKIWSHLLNYCRQTMLL